MALSIFVPVRLGAMVPVTEIRASDGSRTQEQGTNVTAQHNTISATLDGFVSGPLSSHFRAVRADLTKESDVERLFGENPLGPVQIAIINHGIWPTADVLVRDMRLEREKSWCAARRRHAGRFMSSSKTSEYVSGDIIMVDGGMEGRLLNNPEDM
ncbi:hypothetical protein C8J57DRAFT_1228705 [Mycena rebaudengoi]|nr:hypothetical protein C8J57DRAFT_1228705 [Mycena rebaudengoi]